MVQTAGFHQDRDRETPGRSPILENRREDDFGPRETRELPVLGVTIGLVDLDTSALTELYPTNALKLDAVVEGQRHHFDVRIDGRELPLGWDVRIGHQLAERHIVSGRSYFACDLSFYSGQLSFKVLDRDRVAASATVTVNPSLAKLTADQYSALLQDLTDWTRALYRVVGATNPASVAVGQTNHLITINLIACYIDLLEAAVHRLADRPMVRFSSDDEDVSIFRAKTITGRGIRHALRDPRLRRATGAESMAAPGLVAALGGNFADKVRQRRRLRHSDIYEHRALLGFLNWLDGICMRLARSLGAETERNRNILLADIAVWRAKIAKMRRRDIFHGLEPESSLRPSNIFTMKPSYRSAYSIAMKLRQGLGSSGFQIPLPIAQTPQLYEMWCLAGLLLAVANRYPAARDSIRAGLLGGAAKDGFGWVLPQDETWTIPIDGNIVLNYQLRLGTGSGAYGLRTTVVGAIPDITFARLGAAHVAEAVIVLDPKYRVGLSLQDGIRSLHFYRDAIIAADGSNPIIGAVAIHPDVNFPQSMPVLMPDRPTAVLFRPGLQSNFDALVHASVSTLLAPVSLAS